MAPINTMSVLAFATAAFAVPFNGHGHGHAKYHNNKPSGFSAYPYPSANGTGLYPTGTGFATGTAIAPASETVVVSDVVSEYETTTAFATADAGTTSTCTSDVTVTTTVKRTVTVTPGAASSTEVASSSSSEAAPVESTVESSAPAYSEAPTSYSTKAEAVTQASDVAPAAYSSPAPSSSASSSVEESSSAALPTMTYSAANKGNVGIDIGYGSSSSSSAAPSSTASTSSGKSGKRGVAYNDAKLTDCLVSSPAVSWGYNWGSSSSGLSDSVKFIPTLWGPKSEFTNDWSKNAQSAIESGSTHLFSFNEPDLGEQANLSPSEAAAAYKQYMEPFAGKAKLCAPSVTNGGGSMGLSWLSSFLESCSDCTIDCLNIHWYDSAENSEYFKKHVNDAADLASGKQIFISEFAATGSDDQISTFLQDVMPWMDSNDAVGGYAYFMAGEGKLVSGNEQSTIGKVFASSS
ncbi:hypothetical protein Q7P35_008514 [Cladosporium inversicolor]